MAMPELPEVETTRRGIAGHLVGRRVLEVVVRERRLRWPVSAEVIELEGQSVLEVARRAKYLLLRASTGTLLVHLGMSGSLRLAGDEIPWKKHDHVALRLEGGQQLRLHDPRRFGAVLWVQGEVAEHPLLRHLGPEPLEAAFDAAALRMALRGKTCAIKSALMDASVVVGVGNIYANEALFMAGIHPTAIAGRVSLARLEALVRAVKRVLARSIQRGGTTLRDFLNERGEPGYFSQSLRVYDREGKPCRRCGREIVRVLQSQRATYFCPSCQKR